MSPIPHLMTLADLSPLQIRNLLTHAHHCKHTSLPWLRPQNPFLGSSGAQRNRMRLPSQSLFNKTVALIFSKRSTRTRLAAETSASLLGGRALFLSPQDIQLGVNESLRDTSRIVGGMCQGVFARVGDHSEIEEFAKYSPVPVINALSSLWHPTQVLADLLTLHEHADLFTASEPSQNAPNANASSKSNNKKPFPALAPLPPLTVAYIGDSANVLHDMLATYPRLGHSLRVASPPGYRPPPEVWAAVGEQSKAEIFWSDDPKEAVKGADVVVTDTWISMGQEHEKEQRLRDFAGYQVTEALCKEGGAKENWKFMHCLPRKQDEVDDEVFYGPRSLVFPEADNRKWTIMALFDLIIGKWSYEWHRTPTRSNVNDSPGPSPSSSTPSPPS